MIHTTICSRDLSTAVSSSLCGSRQNAELTTTGCVVEHLAAGGSVVNLGSNHDIVISTLTGLVVGGETP